ncbi:hypothetical protein RND81_14G061900 [Saponaria officinalis]|uniref:Aminotransferase-like plant mobile domain-containing protein n=1 Tax=Saponaria officinalis TaxID=3572 RepID=A0AAW1GJ46_SAPOF
MSPKGFHYVIECLETAEQLQALEDIGFHGLYWLRVKTLPLHLGYWLLDNFNPFKNCLVLADGEELRLTEKDVRDTLGLPMGTKEVLVAKSSTESKQFSDFYTTWKEQFQTLEKGQVLTKTLQYQVVNQVDGGDLFKVNFVVLAVSVLLKNNQNRYVNHRILKSLMNVNEIKDYNWCAFVLKCLRESTLEWKSKKNFFCGPLIFLMLCYVDRVVRGDRTVKPRGYFTLDGWTTALLNSREREEIDHGEFGVGFIDEPMGEVVDSSQVHLDGDVGGNEEDAQCGKTEDTGGAGVCNDVKDFVNNLVFTTKLVAENLVSLKSMLNVADKVLPDDVKIKKLCSVAQDLVNDRYSQSQRSPSIISNSILTPDCAKDLLRIQVV